MKLSKAIHKKTARFIRKAAGQQPLLACVVIAIVAATGTYLLAHSHAASPYATQEAAKGTLGYGACSITDGTASDGRSVQFTGSSCQAVTPEPPNAYNVITYGADATGKNDSSTAINDAIAAAQAAGPGNIVYFPAGTYTEDRDVHITTTIPVTLLGASQSTSTIQGTTTSSDLLSIEVDHVTVDNLTFDSSSYKPVTGTDGQLTPGSGVVDSSANYTTIENCDIIGANDTNWPLRFAGGGGTATPANPTYATGNVVNNLILYDDPPPQNDGLDFSFQENGSISNVWETGSRLGMYIDKNVTVSNYHYTPNPLLSSGTDGFFISAPGISITVNGFYTTGSGGIIGPIRTADPTGPSTDITINNDQMAHGDTSTLNLGDVIGVTVSNSNLNELLLTPHDKLSNLTVTSSIISNLDCAPNQGATITDIVGVSSTELMKCKGYST